MENWTTGRQVGRHTELLTLSPIKPGPYPGEKRSYAERLEERLNLFQDRIRRNRPSPVQTIATIHFARWAVLRPGAYMPSRHGPGDTPDPQAWLLFGVSFDGDLKAYIGTFSSQIAESIDDVWNHCIDWPGAADLEGLWQYVRASQVKANGFISAYPEISVQDVLRDAELARRLRAFATANRDRVTGQWPADIGERLDRFLMHAASADIGYPSEAGIYDHSQDARAQALRVYPPAYGPAPANTNEEAG